MRALGAYALGCVGLLAAACEREPPIGDGFRWYLVGAAGAGALAPGFGLAASEVRGAEVRTRHGRRIARKLLEPAEPGPALGLTPADSRLRVAWVVDRAAPVFAEPVEERPIGARERFERLELADGSAPAGWVHARIGWLKAAQLRVPTSAPPPLEVSGAERWIDLELASQTLVVYEGDRPIFATLVSTGVGAPGSRLGTPRGLFHVQYKVPTASMDNLEEAGRTPRYSFEDVPWVQFFHKEIALHGAYWHQRFGHPVSHGCVNLSPPDARRLYGLTRAPAFGLGTIVRVR